MRTVACDDAMGEVADVRRPVYVSSADLVVSAMRLAGLAEN